MLPGLAASDLSNLEKGKGTSKCASIRAVQAGSLVVKRHATSSLPLDDHAAWQECRHADCASVLLDRRLHSQPHTVRAARICVAVWCRVAFPIHAHARDLAACQIEVEAPAGRAAPGRSRRTALAALPHADRTYLASLRGDACDRRVVQVVYHFSPMVLDMLDNPHRATGQCDHIGRGQRILDLD